MAVKNAEELAAENAKLKQELERNKAEIETLRGQQLNSELSPEMEAMVKEKIMAGLPFNDALAVSKRQLKHDRQLAEAEAKARAEKKQPAKAN